ncbi:WD40 repeat domain-containing protein [Streptomyces griseorubiginosus]|uniref:WD40 repeat domain-containing protein n=1 Tax=Streptomyces griseorubiginosus TaxID=67304 RepID=UPI0034539567
MAFSPDGKLLAAASGSGVRIWDPATAENIMPCTPGVYWRCRSVPVETCWSASAPRGCARPLAQPTRPRETETRAHYQDEGRRSHRNPGRRRRRGRRRHRRRPPRKRRRTEGAPRPPPPR